METENRIIDYLYVIVSIALAAMIVIDILNADTIARYVDLAVPTAVCCAISAVMAGDSSVARPFLLVDVMLSAVVIVMGIIGY